jgi:hypothetical protein
MTRRQFAHQRAELRLALPAVQEQHAGLVGQPARLQALRETPACDDAFARFGPARQVGGEPS